MTFDPNLPGTIIVAALGLAALLVLIWPRREPDDELEDIRNRMHSECANAVADAGLLESHRLQAIALGDRMARDVHAGVRSEEEAAHHMRATVAGWTRALREAGAA